MIFFIKISLIISFFIFSCILSKFFIFQFSSHFTSDITDSGTSSVNGFNPKRTPPIMEPKSPPSKSPVPSILDRLIKVDTALSLHLHTTTQSILPRSLLKTLEISGDGRLFFPVVISLFLSPLSTTSHYLRLFLADLLIGSVVDLLLIGLIKHLVRRPRPVYNKGMSLAFAVDHWSFPSGHSSRVCFIAAFSYLSFELIGRALDELKSSGDQFVADWIGLIGSDDDLVGEGVCTSHGQCSATGPYICSLQLGLII
ncbi:uncharacterized protein LOC132304020 isoform X2 [Cornus florida]|uniref:uncharacterized protein LOC132304020 isoform X2 n=1 Tax=Cornus florida TaxID=4283 RepID=UPI0028A04938|nr:uncharacterized protein LOC132304020 isoform X2 [Cornus florida]